VAELEQEHKQIREAAVAHKKELEDALVEEKRKTQEANAQFNAASIGKIESFLEIYSPLMLSCVA
jgi:hypothetical protein